MNTFLLMLQLFTKVPIRKEIPFDRKTVSLGVVYFPLIGLIIGIMVSLPTYAAERYFGREVSALIMIFSQAALTGGLHLDGLADTMDGILSARSRDKMLLIMKDSRIGTHGVLALIFTIFVKYQFLLEVENSLYMLMVIVLPVAGRTAISVMLIGSRYAREDGLGNLFIGKTESVKSLASGVLGMLITLFFLGLNGIAALGITLVLTALLRMRLNKILAGLTGDTLGALNEMAELIYIPIYILIERGVNLL
jgi:adenosylcobinamide-GDP ribazoletransferase